MYVTVTCLFLCMYRHKLYLATQYSGEFLSKPIRVSAGLTVTGLSENIRTLFFTATCISCHCSSICFYLSRCDPSRFKCLKSVFTKTNSITSRRYSLHSSSMSLATKVTKPFSHGEQVLYFKYVL
ncbi:hypothetical protein Hanom_Chr07g00680101 [Helianthus anomalus]